MTSARRPNMRPVNLNRRPRASAPSSFNRIRYMPDKSTIVTAASAARLRTAEQRRVMADRLLGPVYRVWPHGGGLVHNDATIHVNAFVGLCAIVDEHARIGKYAIIAGEAEVDGTVVNESCVDGNAVVEEGARVHDYAHVTGDAVLLNGAYVGGHVTVGGHSALGENVHLGGGFTITMGEDEQFTLEDFVYVLGNNITISKVSQIKALEKAMNDQVQ